MQYQFTYWPIPFRGNFVRNLFAYTNTEYVEISKYEQIVAQKNQPVTDQLCPYMGPPLFEDKTNNVCLSQMTAIMFYLGEQLDLMPGDLAGKALTLKVIGDCNDLLSEITRSNGNQLWDQPAWDEFMSGRFVQWLQIFEETLRRGLLEGGTSLLAESSATVADLARHALFATMERCLPQLSPILRQHAPTVLATCDQVSENDGIKALVSKQTKEFGQMYCGGEIEKSLRAVQVTM